MISHHLIPCLLLLTTLYTCQKVGTELSVKERAAYKLVNAPPLAALDPKTLDTLMLGHSGLYDDFALIWANQFLADSKLKESTNAEDLYKALFAIMRHQPKVEGLYILSCFVLSFDFQRPEYCEKISIEGLKAFPESWRIPMTQGFITSFVMKDDLKAAAFYQLAASRPKSPEYVGKLAARLTARGFADGQDLNETIQLMTQIPGGTQITELLRERLKDVAPPDRSGGSP